MLSDRSRMQWATYLAVKRAQATPFGHRDELHRFIIGVHLRGEQVTVNELRELLDEAGSAATERDAVSAFVEDGLALLASYEALLAAENEAYADGAHGGFEV